MYLLGYSLDNLSLMALTISTGFVVDDAIVMIENITRYIEEGSPDAGRVERSRDWVHDSLPHRVADRRADPLLFMQDVVGRLFREFAITLSVTILVSAVVSLTLTPMMCSKISASPKKIRKRSWFYRASENSLNWIIDRYAVILRFRSEAFKPATLVVTVGTLPTGFTFLLHPQGLFSRCRYRRHFGRFEAAGAFHFQRWREEQAPRESDFEGSDVVSLSSFIGIDGANMLPNSGRIQII